MQGFGVFGGEAQDALGLGEVLLDLEQFLLRVEGHLVDPKSLCRSDHLVLLDRVGLDHVCRVDPERDCLFDFAQTRNVHSHTLLDRKWQEAGVALHCLEDFHAGQQLAPQVHSVFDTLWVF